MGKVLQETILQHYNDGNKHKREDIIEKISKLCQNEKYSDGQFSGDFATLVKKGKLKRLDRGYYQVPESNDLSPIREILNTALNSIVSFTKKVDILNLTEEDFKDIEKIRTVRDELQKLLQGLH